MWVTTFEHDMRPRDKDMLGWSEFRALVEHNSRYLQLDDQSFVAQIYGVSAATSTECDLVQVVRWGLAPG